MADAGLDLCAAAALSLEPGEWKLVGTGISIELPPDTEAQVRPRSGLALKHGITVLNTPGTIDHGYRGEVGVILINHGQARFDIQPGMKIAQMVIAPTSTPVGVEESGEPSSHTERGHGGSDRREAETGETGRGVVEVSRGRVPCPRKKPGAWVRHRRGSRISEPFVLG